MRIVLIGAGSFVFGAGLIADLILVHRRAGTHLALVDPRAPHLEDLAGYARRLAADTGVAVTVSTHRERAAALAGADAVILSASPGGVAAWRADREVLAAHGLAAQARECGGLGGLVNACRSIALVLEVCADMRRLCPQAGLWDVTNPMPRVVAAANRFGGVRTHGFCNAAWGGADGYRNVASYLGREPAELEVVSAGLNHFTWLLAVRDRASGADLLPQIEANVRAGVAGPFGDPAVVAGWLERFGAVPLAGWTHHGEYLEPDPRIPVDAPYHGDPAERAALLAEIADLAAGRRDWRQRRPAGAWEHPLDLIFAIADRTAIRLDMVNQPNAGHLPELPAGATVETPLAVVDGVTRPVTLPALPPQVAVICRRVSQVNELVAAGAATGNRELLLEALRLDPAIPDAGAAEPVLSELLERNAAFLPSFFPQRAARSGS